MVSCLPDVNLAGNCPLNHFIPRNGPQAISKKEVRDFRNLVCVLKREKTDITKAPPSSEKDGNLFL